MPDHVWYEHPHYHQVRKPLGIDHFVLSVFLGPSADNLMFLVVYRPCQGGQRFTPRDVASLDLCHSALAWLYRTEEKHRPVDTTLSPRLNQTLTFLMTGKGEKEIAELTALSIHTIHDYVKALYRHFHVSSRSELLARFISQ